VTVSQILAFPGAYRDSLLLLGATRAMQNSEDVTWASAAMATPAVVADLTGRGFPPGGLAGADANALVLAVRAADDGAARQALDRGRAMLFAEDGRDRGDAAETGGTWVRPDPRTVGEAARLLPEANVAVVSVPGPYAAIAAHSALTAGLQFSDNVSVSDEMTLKQRASRLGRLVMGPGAGTAMLGGVGLGFANAVGAGPVGVVAAAGTGAQEVMTLLDRWGIGVSRVIGVGGRDLSAAVGGLMARDAVRALDADPSTQVILLVSKPPDERVARAVIAASQGTPVVACCSAPCRTPNCPAGTPRPTCSPFPPPRRAGAWRCSKR
jgi:FdrA protein